MRDIYDFLRPAGLAYLVMEVIGLACGKNIYVIVFPPGDMK